MGGARRLRLVRVLQGPRGGLRAAHLPVGLAQDAPPGGLPGRGAHPRPRHVPQAADPRRRPQLRHRACSGSTSTPPPPATGSSGSAGLDEPPPAILDQVPGRSRRRAGAPARPAAARRRRVRHPARASPTSRASPTTRSPGSSPASPTARCRRLLAPRVGVPAGGRAAGAGRRLRLPLRLRAATVPAAGAAAGDPPRPAAADRRAGPVERRRRGAAQGVRAAGGRPAGRPERGRPGAPLDLDDVRSRPARQSQAPAAPPARRRPARPRPGGRPEQTGRAGCRRSPTPSWSAPSSRCSAWTPAGT